MIARLAALAASLALAACTSAPVDPGCHSNLDCHDGQLCVDGSCQGAATKVDCGRQQRCNGDANCGEHGACEGGCCLPSCATDPDCGADQVCRSGVCREAGAACTADVDCPNATAPTCEPDSGACVRCVADSDCALGEFCQSHGCKAPPASGCSADTQCKAVPQLSHCLATAGRCVACLTDAQCPRPTVGGVTCDLTNHACRVVIPGCDADADCAASPFGKRCDVARRKCVQCQDDSQCPTGAHCTRTHTCDATPACTDATCPHDKPHCRSDRSCVECLISSQCPSGQLCTSNHCVARQNGCYTSALCTDPTPACDLATRTCVTCRSDTDCHLRFCDAGTCVSCTGDLECLEKTLTLRPFCDHGACAQCLGDINCSGGLVCLDHLCAANPLGTPCPATGVCPRDLVCLADPGAGASYCRAACDVYAASSGCPADQRCTLARFSGGLPTGACVPTTPGLPEEGDVCADQQPCDTGLVCVPEAADRGRCRRLCDPNRSTAACGAPNACQPIAQLDPQGVPHTIGACFPDSHYLDACTGDATCDPGQTCAPGPNPQQPTQFRNECLWPKGTKTAAQPCVTDGECRSGLCLQGMPKGQPAPGFCQGGCGSDAACPARSDGMAGACETYPVAWRDQNGAPSLVPLNSCAVQCREDLECQPGAACEAVPNAARTAWVTRCRPIPGDASGKGGAPCTAGTDCRSGTCVTFGARPVGICQGVCGASGDANCATGAACPPNGVLRYVGPGPDNLEHTPDDAWTAAPLCWGRACTADLDCGTSRVCGADPDPHNPKDVVLSCRPSQGTKIGGDSCAQDADCKSGLCVNWSSTNKRCFGACQAAADCAAGSRCNSQHWTSSTPNKLLSVCVP